MEGFAILQIQRYHVHFFLFSFEINGIIEFEFILSMNDMVVECCNRQFGCETMHPTKKILQ